MATSLNGQIESARVSGQQGLVPMGEATPQEISPSVLPVDVEPIDLLTAQAELSGEKEVSLDTLKPKEVEKIMAAVKKCRDIANTYYKSNVEPTLRKREDNFAASEEMFKKKFPTLSESSSWRSRDIKTVVDWIMPSLIDVFTGSDDPVDIKGVNVEDDGNAKKIQQLLKYQLERKNSYFSFLAATLTAALKTNLGIAKVHWLRNEKRESYKMMIDSADLSVLDILNAAVDEGKAEVKSIKKLPDSEQYYQVDFDKIITTANHPAVEYLPASEFRFTPEATSVQECKFVAHRKVVQGDYLKRKEQEGVYQNVDEALERSGNTEPTSSEAGANNSLSSVRKQLSDSDKASKNVELYECYVKVDYNNDGILENLIVHCVGDTPLSIQINELELVPFFLAHGEHDPCNIFPEEGYTDGLEQLQDLKTALVRQVIIAVAKNNIPQKYVTEDVDIDALLAGEEIIVAKAGANPSSSVFIPPQIQISPLTMELVSYAQNEIESQSGSTKYNQGLDSNSLNKMLALDTPIPMADGSYKDNADIIAGDMVIGSDGKATKVLVAHPVQMPKRAFEITFQSGDVIKAGGEHRWSVKVSDKNYRHKSPEWEKLPTERIFDLMNSGHHVQIPRVALTDTVTAFDGAPKSKSKQQRIVSIKEIPVELMRCLTVAAKDELYCCGRRFTLTSNTATGITAIMGAADKRIKMLAKQLAENFLVPLFKYIILLNQRYAEPEQLIRLNNENISIDRESLDIDYDFIINVGRGAGTREVQMQYLMIIMQQLYPILEARGIVDANSWYNIGKDLLENMGLRNTTNYIIDPNSDDGKQRQQMQQQQAQQAQQLQQQLALQQKQLELEKARTPRLSVQYDDLPGDAKMQLLQTFGLNTTPEKVAEQELMNNGQRLYRRV